MTTNLKLTKKGLAVRADWYLCMVSLKRFIGNLVVYKLSSESGAGVQLGWNPRLC